MKTLKRIIILAAPFIAACQTTALAAPAPAVLISDDAQSVTALKSVLAKAMQENSVRLGAVALTQRSTISVLPARAGDPYYNPGFNGNNTALPTQFDMMIDAQGCYVVKRGYAKKYRLNGIACRKLQTQNQ